MPQANRTLVIETATEACSVALFDGTELIAHDHRPMGRGHAESLIPMIAALPDKGRAERILVSLGPGSFTGVRIGIAAARALGVAWGATVFGYPTLALIALRAQSLFDASVTVVINGGHGEWFVQNFALGVVPEGPLASLTPDAAAQGPVHNVIVGTRANDLAALLDAEPREALHILPDSQNAPKLPDALLSDHLTPIYGRGPDAKPQAGYKAPSVA